MTNENLLDVRAVAARLGCGVRTVHRLVTRGELPAVRVLSCLRFDPADLEIFIARQKTPVKADPAGAPAAKLPKRRGPLPKWLRDQIEAEKRRKENAEGGK